MIGNKSYAYDLSVADIKPNYMPKRNDFKIIKAPNKVAKGATDVSKTEAKKPKIKSKTKLSLILSVVALFGMALTISYRYNLISEKNLEIQRLKMEQVTVDSELATTEIAVERIIDKDMIESYAKQQLGMQKPEKSQIVYIDSNYETKVEQVETKNILEIGINKLKELIGIK